MLNVGRGLKSQVSCLKSLSLFLFNLQPATCNLQPSPLTRPMRVPCRLHPRHRTRRLDRPACHHEIRLHQRHDPLRPIRRHLAIRIRIRQDRPARRASARIPRRGNGPVRLYHPRKSRLLRQRGRAIRAAVIHQHRLDNPARRHPHPVETPLQPAQIPRLIIRNNDYGNGLHRFANDGCRLKVKGCREEKGVRGR